MKPKIVKKLLFSEIAAVSDNFRDYCFDPDRDFSRNRKLPFKTIVKNIIGMESKSLTNELIDQFEGLVTYPSSSAFVQQRQKIKPLAFKDIFIRFTNKFMQAQSTEMRVLAVDGSDIQISTNPNDLITYHPGTNGQKPYNLLHLNALYDIENHLYVDAEIQGKRELNEHVALQKMVDKSPILKALVIADRGYESYNNLAHIQEKEWFFLIRIKDGKSGIKEGLTLPNTDEFDEEISLNLTRKQTNEMKELLKDRNHYRAIAKSTPFDYLPTSSRKKDPLQLYELKFRIVRFKISDEM